MTQNIAALAVIAMLVAAAWSTALVSSARTGVPALRWSVERLLRVLGALRRFNAQQLELHERWVRRYVLVEPADGGATSRADQLTP